MKYRARANGNVLDESDVPESLIGVLYDPVEEEGASPTTAPEPPDAPVLRGGSVLATPEAPLLNAAHTGAPDSRTRPRRPRR